MPANPVTALSTSLGIAAANAGLTVLSSEEGIDFNGRPTAIFRIGLSPDAPAERTLRLELSEDFDFNRPELLPAMTTHLREEAKRLRNPRPNAYVTLAGMPITFGDFLGPSTVLFRARIPISSTVSCTWRTAPMPCCTPRFPPA